MDLNLISLSLLNTDDVILNTIDPHISKHHLLTGSSNYPNASFAKNLVMIVNVHMLLGKGHQTYSLI